MPLVSTIYDFVENYAASKGFSLTGDEIAAGKALPATPANLAIFMKKNMAMATTDPLYQYLTLRASSYLPNVASATTFGHTLTPIAPVYVPYEAPNAVQTVVPVVPVVPIAPVTTVADQIAARAVSYQAPWPVVIPLPAPAPAPAPVPVAAPAPPHYFTEYNVYDQGYGTYNIVHTARYGNIKTLVKPPLVPQSQRNLPPAPPPAPTVASTYYHAGYLYDRMSNGAVVKTTTRDPNWKPPTVSYGGYSSYIEWQQHNQPKPFVQPIFIPPPPPVMLTPTITNGYDHYIAGKGTYHYDVWSNGTVLKSLVSLPPITVKTPVITAQVYSADHPAAGMQPLPPGTMGPQYIPPTPTVTHAANYYAPSAPSPTGAYTMPGPNPAVIHYLADQGFINLGPALPPPGYTLPPPKHAVPPNYVPPPLVGPMNPNNLLYSAPHIYANNSPIAKNVYQQNMQSALAAGKTIHMPKGFYQFLMRHRQPARHRIMLKWLHNHPHAIY